MRLTAILQAESVKVPLEAASKSEAIDELVDLLAANKLISDSAALKEAVRQREKTRTTGIGHGIAIPHGKAAGVDQLRMALGLTRTPLEFGAIDGQPVKLIILLASSIDQTGPHIQALARISRMLTDEGFRQAIKAAESADDLYDLIVQYESEIPV